MNKLLFEKIFAAVLIAGITASFSGFVAQKLVKPKKVAVLGVEEADGGGAARVEKIELPEPVLHLVAAADVARGEQLFRACAACHTVNKGGPHGVGPNMWNVKQRGKAVIEEYAYSDALMEMQGQEWDYLAMQKFLWKPKWYVPGTKMNYIGLRKPEDRAAMLAYLRTLSDTPYPLPSDAEIQAEIAELMPVVEEAVSDSEATEEGVPLEDAPEAAVDNPRGATDDLPAEVPVEE